MSDSREEPLRQLLVINPSLKKELLVFSGHFCFSFSRVIPEFIRDLARPHFFWTHTYRARLTRIVG